MLRCVLYCWLPWRFSLSVPRHPNLECFSVLTSGWTYPGPFPTQTILSFMKPLHFSTSLSLSWDEGAGHSYQANPISHDVPWPLPLLKNRWEMVDPNLLFAAHHTGYGESLAIHTPHPLQTLAKLTFSHLSASQHLDSALSKWLHLWIFGVAYE